eukprot:jgi/Tetstr1/449664/TSEL_036732.t1
MLDSASLTCPTPLKKRHRVYVSPQPARDLSPTAPTPPQATPPAKPWDADSAEHVCKAMSSPAMSEEEATALLGAAVSTPQQASQLSARTERAKSASDCLPPPGTRVFVQVPNLIRTHLTCTICSDIVCEPVTVARRCQHMFCRGCVLAEYRQQRSAAVQAGVPHLKLACHTCDASVPAPTDETGLMTLLEPSLMAGNMLNELDVYCRWGLKKVGDRWEPCQGKHFCPAVLKAGEVEEHEASCPHESVACVVPGCGAVMLRRSQQRHMRDNAPSHVDALLAENAALEGELAEAEGALNSLLARVSALEAELAAARAPRAEAAVCSGTLTPGTSPAPRKRARSSLGAASSAPKSTPSSAVKRVQPLQDAYRWRKYGEKTVNGLDTPRSYYRCSYPDCPARKMVEEVRGQVKETLRGEHSHPPPQASK